MVPLDDLPPGTAKCDVLSARDLGDGATEVRWVIDVVDGVAHVVTVTHTLSVEYVDD
jgi:hypothetical protein